MAVCRTVYFRISQKSSTTWCHRELTLGRCPGLGLDFADELAKVFERVAAGVHVTGSPVDGKSVGAV